MNGYLASNSWYRFAEANKEKIKPVHSAIIHWCYSVANSLKWPELFQLPTVDACLMIGITDRETFHKGLKDLVNFGAIKVVQESTGRYVARWVTLDLPEFYRPFLSEGTAEGIPEGKPKVPPKVVQPNINDLKEEELLKGNKSIPDADRVGDSENPLPDKKRSKKETPPGSAQPPSLHSELRLMIEGMNEGYYWQAKDGTALKSLIKKMTFRWKAKHKNEPAEIDLINSFKWILDNLPDFYKNKWDTCLIDSKFEPIIKELTDNNRNGKSDPNKTTQGVSPQLQRVWQRIAERHSGKQP